MTLSAGFDAVAGMLRAEQTDLTNVAAFERLLGALPNPDPEAQIAARAHQDTLTKPPGALGRLEDIACFMAGWQSNAYPNAEQPHLLIFAGNHGVAARAVSPYPVEVTAQMVANFKAGGAAVNALARTAGVQLSVVPLDLERPTADFTLGPAMSEADCLQALETGARSIPQSCDLLLIGEMGIGNTTVAAGLGAALFGGSGEDWAGPGTGLDSAGVSKKADIIDQALTRHLVKSTTTFELLRRLGGREQAAIAGAVLAARHRRIPVLLDGFSATAGAAVLVKDNPDALTHCLAGHLSAEPAHAGFLEATTLKPLLSLGMRLGEGTGAVLAYNVVKAALAAHNEMASFSTAGVSNRETP